MNHITVKAILSGPKGPKAPSVILSPTNITYFSQIHTK